MYALCECECESDCVYCLGLDAVCDMYALCDIGSAAAAGINTILQFRLKQHTHNRTHNARK